MPTPAPRLTLSCAVRLAPSQLHVEYAVRNDGPAEAGLFNRLRSTSLDGTLRYAPENVYVDLEDGVLLLRMMALPMPEGLQAAEREVPDVALLRAGQTFREAFALPVPVAVQNPLRRAALAGSSPTGVVVADRAAEAAGVVLALGVFAVDPAWRLIPVSPAHPDVYRVWPPGPPVDRQVVLTCQERLSRPLPVLDYRLVEPDE